MKVKTGVKPKPFLKWVGGKSQLLSQLEKLFPKTFEAYFEPFFGGGAVFFALAPVTGQINDINKSLTSAYVDVRDKVEELIEILRVLESRYLELETESRSEFYYQRRV